jgi:Hypervirulence associated proteins TUDOR domain
MAFEREIYMKSKKISLKEGEKVEWQTPQGKTSGTVKHKLTDPLMIKNHKVAASEEDPEYLVVSDKSGQEAAHKPEALSRKGK